MPMDLKDVQAALRAQGFYKDPPYKIDGLDGAGTRSSIEQALAKIGISKQTLATWSDARKRTAFEQSLLKEKKFYEGDIDGLSGELTRRALALYEAEKKGPAALEKAKNFEIEQQQKTPANPVVAPTKNAGPGTVLKARAPGGIDITLPSAAQIAAARAKLPHQSQMSSFYGAPGKNLVRFEFPFPQVVAWDLKSTVNSTMVAAKAEPLFREIWTNVLKHYGMDEIRRLRLNMYGGCYNNRSMLGGNRPSTHAYGAAWDVDPERNQMYWKRAQASLDHPDYDAFWGIVESVGGLSLGRHADYDWMHFQLTRSFQ